MNLRRIIIIIIPAVMLYSCTWNEEIPDSSGIIPEKDLIPILTEIRIADGLLANPKIQQWVLTIDTVSTYYHINEKYGYTKEAFDKTIHYYFVKKPKKLIRIYDKVLAKLSEMESRLEKEVKLAREHSTNIWPGERNYFSPDIPEIKSLDFMVTLAGNRTYNLKFTATVFPDDQSLNPKVKAFTCRADSIETGTRKYFEMPAYIKDGNPHTYSISIPLGTNDAVTLKGNLYDINNQLESWQRHFSFENITLSIPSADI